MSIFDHLILTLFSGQLAKSAVYKKTGHPDVAVQVIAIMPDEIIGVEGLEIVQSSRFFDTPASGIPSPSKGDTLTVDGTIYKIRSWTRRDSDRAILTLSVV